jgi:hypothetical protein
MFVSVIVQSISVPRSTNVTTPVPVVVLAGCSFAGDRFATYCFEPRPVESEPQLAATKAIVAATATPAAIPTVLRIEPPGERKVQARESAKNGQPIFVNDRLLAASSRYRKVGVGLARSG